MNYTSEEIAEKMYQLADKIRYHKSKMYNGNFKVNAIENNGVSERQFIILILISAFKVNTVTAISEVFQQTTGSVSTVISKLVRDGYLEKQYPTGLQDKRKVYYAITKEGNQLIRKVLNDFVLHTTEFLKTFTPEMKEGLKKAADNISFLIQEHNDKNGLLAMIDRLSYDFKDPDEQMTFIFIKHIMAYAERVTKEGTIKLTKGDHVKINENRFCVLARICEAGYESIAQLASYVNLSESAVSIILSKLVDDGFLVRKYPDSSQDGRKVYFEATAEGILIYDKIKHDICSIFAVYYDELNAEKKVMVVESIEMFTKIFT